MFDLKVIAKSSNRIEGKGFIGIGFRSQHFYSNYTHMVYLTHEGEIILVQPDDDHELHYRDIKLRGATKIDHDADHRFEVALDDVTLKIRVDEFSSDRKVAEMPKVLGPGLIRFQSYSSWMAVSRVWLK